MSYFSPNDFNQIYIECVTLERHFRNNTSGKIKFMTLVHKGSEYHSCDSQNMRFGDRRLKIPGTQYELGTHWLLY